MTSNNPLALIIEDEENLATIFASALQTAKFETEVISEGDTAITRLQQIIPAVVVLDLHLPNVSGVEILKAIRADNRLDKTRVILATADSLKADSMRAEADLVLLKPISFAQLRDLATRLRPPDTIKD